MQLRGITIVVSTPYMDEAALCDHVALMQNGKLLAVDKPDNIVNKYKGNLFAVSTNNMHKLLTDLNNLKNTSQIFRFGETIHITSTITDDQLYSNEVYKHLEDAGYQNIGITRIKPVIEDCFLALMDKNVMS